MALKHRARVGLQRDVVGNKRLLVFRSLSL